ncbi:MAG: hypothetical protein HEQ22_07880 [Sphingopyxis sp.]|uniref:hypothetical protein n=1 Tax=Sphingopyxis sp. TaxID=1908224 RepID=UPI003D80CBE6
MLSFLLAAAQAPEQPVRMDTTPAPWPDPEREKDGAIYKAGPEARQTMARYAACIADGSPDKVADVLTRDFRTTEYRNGLRNLSRANEGCARRTGLRDTLRMNNLPFAAALAEVMIERDTAPLNARLAKAASGKEAPTFAPSDKVAMCVARSTPDDVAALFASEPGSDGEEQAAAKLLPVADMCGQGVKVEASVTGLRSILATASFRLLAAQES